MPSATGFAALKPMKNLRSDVRILVTSFGILLAMTPDPEVDGFDGDQTQPSDVAYGAADWRDTTAPSFAFDEDGDLRRHNGERCYGDVIEFREGTADDLASDPEWANSGLLWSANAA